jgi:hypothetical protein
VTVLGDLLHLIGRYGYLAVFAALVAGTSRMPWGTFAPYNVLGGTVWASAVVSLGYFLWASISLVEHWVGRASRTNSTCPRLAVALRIPGDHARMRTTRSARPRRTAVVKGVHDRGCAGDSRVGRT